jgi:hypothetical protein
MRPLTTIFVEVLTRVTELLKMDENARGMSNLDGLIRVRRAIPITTGINRAVEAVLLMNAPMKAERTITTRSSLAG